MAEIAHAPFSLSLPSATLAQYVARQLYAAFPDRDESEHVRSVMPDTLDRLEHCIRHVRIKGYWGHDGPQFNHLHTDQYAVFLYLLANTAFRRGLISLASKAYALNKAYHGLDAYYEVELPEIFAVMHPIGTVLGRATYGDFFLAYQNVTIGSDREFRRPVIGEGVVMFGGSSIIGAVTVGSNCVIATGACLLGGSGGLHVPDNHVAFGVHPRAATKPTRHHVKRDIFKDGS